MANHSIMHYFRLYLRPIFCWSLAMGIGYYLCHHGLADYIGLSCPSCSVNTLRILLITSRWYYLYAWCPIISHAKAATWSRLLAFICIIRCDTHVYFNLFNAIQLTTRHNFNRKGPKSSIFGIDLDPFIIYKNCCMKHNNL